jgi:DNA-directed RNA polymerase subunit H (RpoH/RPB5)
LFTQKFNQLTPLPYSFNIKNTKDLIHILKDAPILPHFTFASLDITNLYSNIPVTETKKIPADIMEHNLIDSQTQQELLNWYDVITKQNYFINNSDIIIQNNRLAMGAPSSSLIAEIFLQHTENSHLAHLAQKHRIVNYFHYVDDILLIFLPKPHEHTSYLK